MHVSRLHRAALKALLGFVLVFVGIYYGTDLWGDFYRRNWEDRYADWGQSLYWSGSALLMLVVVFGKTARWLVGYLRFQGRVKEALPGLGKERNALLKGAYAIQREQELRAVELLEGLESSTNTEVRSAARYLCALAGTRFLKTHRRLLSIHRERYPQLHGLFFSHGRVPLRRGMLVRELGEIQSKDLDAMLLSYLDLVDRMISALGNPAAPFHSESEAILEYLTGRTYLYHAHDRFKAWWKEHRMILVRGGGVLYAGVRLVQREYYGEVVDLLKRLGSDGLLSEQTETVRKMSSFFALLARPQWRLTSEDLPQFFREAYYHGCMEMGILRFPAAELPEVVAGSRRGRDYRRMKVGAIEEALDLWHAFGEELASPLSVFLKRLLNHTGRQCPARLDYWRKQWAGKKDRFEESTMKVMEGVVAAADGHLAKANQDFEQALKLDPIACTPLVNQVYLALVEGRDEEARGLGREVIRRFPQDGGAFVSLGRLFATHLEDTKAAESLFRHARELDRTATEPLICLGEVKLMEGKYNESQAYFDKAKDLDATSQEAKLGLARTYMETKRYRLAVDNLLPVAEDGKGDAKHFAQYLLYRSYRDMSDHQNAIKYLDLVPTPFFKEPDILDDIAFHLESEKHYAKAREFSERAMVLRAKGIQRGDDLEPIGEI